MSPELFKEQMARMMGLRFAPANLETHWEALADVPFQVLEAAVSLAQKTRTEFPTPVELRQDADQVAHHVREIEPEKDRMRVLPTPYEFVIPHSEKRVRITQEYQPECDDCGDLGMRTFWCGERQKTDTGLVRQHWTDSRTCERWAPHGGHEWVQKCACWDTNPVLIRKRDNQAKYAATGAQKRTRD